MFLYKHILLEIINRATKKENTKQNHSKLHLFCISNSKEENYNAYAQN